MGDRFDPFLTFLTPFGPFLTQKSSFWPLDLQNLKNDPKWSFLTFLDFSTPSKNLKNDSKTLKNPKNDLFPLPEPLDRPR